MADTKRTTAALLALLADTAPAHSTNRQLLRDILVSLGLMRALVFNVMDAPFLAIGNGTADDTAAIQAADLAASLTPGGSVHFPAGTYKTSSNLVVSRKWTAVPTGGEGFGTIIMPTAAVTKCFDVRSQGWLEGFSVDGVSTSGKTGIDVGTALLVTQVVVRNCMVRRFGGVGGRGFKLMQCVNGQFENIYAESNYVNYHCAGGGNLTTSEFTRCQAQSATTKGWWIESGASIGLHSILGQASGEEGLYFQNVGGTTIAVVIDGASWFESNWTTLAAGAARHAKYEVFCDGATGPAGTIRFAMRDALFNCGAGTARAMRLTNCTGYLIDNISVFNEAANILVDGTSYGKFENWLESNGAFQTVVSYVPGSAWNSRDQMQNGLWGMGGAAWVATPALQNGWINFGAPYANAQYMIDPSGWVHLRGTIKSGTVTPVTLLFTLPVGFRPTNQIIFPTVSNDLFATIYIQANGLVSINGGASAVYLALDGITFRTY